MSDKFLLLDIGSRKSESNQFEPLFGNSLIEQYKTSSLPGEYGMDEFEDFVRAELLRKVDIHISYPDFERGGELPKDKWGNTFYNNVALRIPGRTSDIVLMGDVVEKNTERRVKREYRVKGILTMDPNIGHYGETDEGGVTIIAKLDRNGNWEGPNDFSAKWPTDEMFDNNIFDSNMMLKLSKTFIVRDVGQVNDMIWTWRKYLASRKYLVDTNSDMGYDIAGTPDIIRAYSNNLPAAAAVESRLLDPGMPRTTPYLTLEPESNDKSVSEEKLLVRINIEKNYREYEKSREEPARGRRRNDLKSQIDSFTRSPMSIVDPSRVRKNRRGEEEAVSVLNIRDGRICPSILTKVEPAEELSALDEELEIRMGRISSDYSKNLRAAVKKDVDTYVSGEMQSELSRYVTEQRAPVRNRIAPPMQAAREEEEQRLTGERSRLEKSLAEKEKSADEARAKIEILEAEVGDLEKQREEAKDSKKKEAKKSEKKADTKDLESKIAEDRRELKSLNTAIQEYEGLRKRVEEISSQIEGLGARYDIDGAVEEELGRMRSVREKALTDAKREESEGIRSAELGRIRKEEEEKAKLDIQTRKEEAIENDSIARFTLYFEIDVEESDSIEALANTYASAMVSGMQLRKDFTGERAIIWRQEEAINNLWRGYVKNPFLATSLFSPASEGRYRTAEIDDGQFYLSNLNESQKEAVRKAVSSNGMFLIQGPPGTGKTQVIAEITAQLVKSGKKVLIASENNKAVDNAFSRLPRDPMLRCIRVLGVVKKKDEENPYVMSSLTSNFYTNVAYRLDREIEKYNNHRKYAEELEETIEELREGIDNVKSLENEAERVSEDIETIEKDIEKHLDKLSKIDESSAEADVRIDELSNERKAVEDFDEPEEVLAEIEKKTGVSIPAEGGASVLKAFHTADIGDIDGELLKRMDHEELFALYARKEKAETKDIPALNAQIKLYEDEHGVSMKDDFPILSSFGGDIPKDEDVQEIKDIVDDYVAEKTAPIDAQIEKVNKLRRNPAEAKQRLAELKAEREEKASDPVYRKLQAAKNDLGVKIRGIMNELGITTPYDTFEEAVERLESERGSLERMDTSSSTANKIAAFTKISRYLKSKDILEKDSAAYNSVLFECVNVIGMTCSTRNTFKNEFAQRSEDENVNLGRLNIDVVIIDEVSKTSFVELLQPILYGKTVILVGDHRQLPPMYSNEVDADEMDRYDPAYINESDEKSYKRLVETSFFGVLFEKTPDAYKTQLNIQYRMHPQIMAVDNVFYNNALIAGCKDSEKRHYLRVEGANGKTIIDDSKHIIFVDVKGREKKESGSTSYYNDEEIAVVRRLVGMLNDSCRCDRNGQPLRGKEFGQFNDTRLSVGVICPYADQARRIRKGMPRYRSFNASPDEKFMVKTVDDFQGDERDIIILTMVRTTKSRFLENYHRINVAVSRARRLLVIVGNGEVLKKMRVNLNDMGNQEPLYKPVYQQMIQAIQRSDGCLAAEDITGAR